MNEAKTYDALKPHLTRWGLDPHRIENILNAGTPDVNYTGGWIEMKYRSQWPVLSTTIVHLMDDRPQQAAWLYRRWRAGGAAFVLLRVDNHLFLFSGLDAPAIYKGMTRAQLMDICCWNGEKQPFDWLKLWLTRDVENLPPPQRARLLRLLCGYTIQAAYELTGIDPMLIHKGETGDTTITNDLIDAWVT